jgi:hypothetical protein
MPHRDFEAARREETREPITFSWRGRTFRCVDELPWAFIEDLLSKVPLDEGGRMDQARIDRLGIMLQIGPFLRGVVVPDDVLAPDGQVVAYGSGELDKILRSKADPIGLGDTETLVAIMSWLIETYLGRPTRPLSDSPRGPSSIGASLKAVSSSPATGPEGGLRSEPGPAGQS